MPVACHFPELRHHRYRQPAKAVSHPKSVPSPRPPNRRVSPLDSSGRCAATSVDATGLMSVSCRQRQTRRHEEETAPRARRSRTTQQKDLAAIVRIGRIDHRTPSVASKSSRTTDACGPCRGDGHVGPPAAEDGRRMDERGNALGISSAIRSHWRRYICAPSRNRRSPGPAWTVPSVHGTGSRRRFGVCARALPARRRASALLRGCPGRVRGDADATMPETSSPDCGSRSRTTRRAMANCRTSDTWSSAAVRPGDLRFGARHE